MSQVDEFTDANSLLSMTLASLRLAGLDPAISEALQHSPGYLDMAQVALHTTGYCKHPSTSPLSSIHSGGASASDSHHKPQQPIFSPVITLANANYSITRTYPSLLIVPSVGLNHYSVDVQNFLVVFRKLIDLYQFKRVLQNDTI